MAKELIKGNEAIIKGALLAGAECFFGYPITPASEVAHAAAFYFPAIGRTFLQAESEIASIQMCYGAASAGVRCMTASSGPGVSLKQEGVSYSAGSELPIVIADIMRGGPGLGNIAPEQSDYNQVVKGGGHGNYKCIVVAPNCGQEMCDLTILAFELADKYRTPVYLLADGFIGQMMEPVEFPEPMTIDQSHKAEWAIMGNTETVRNLITSIYLEPEELEDHNRKLQRKYAEIEKNEIRYEEYKTEDAEIILTGYGIVSRVLKSTVDALRKEGVKAGLFRPITLFPFPKAKFAEMAEKVDNILVAELSNGQMVDDVRLAIDCAKAKVHFYGRMGGVVPTVAEMVEKVNEIVKG
ncbi:MAG TPA: 3-methyl-2-oxobutanoate dehydrogenase subunit VorB [candidate division Zixibacteria bacterium]|nr:3-methyl-2-oxobutanoate dehydrogenase subunit VorB [candidate division Zixibacteria bacterium]